MLVLQWFLATQCLELKVSTYLRDMRFSTVITFSTEDNKPIYNVSIICREMKPGEMQTFSRIFLVYKLPLQPVSLGLGLEAKIFGLTEPVLALLISMITCHKNYTAKTICNAIVCDVPSFYLNDLSLTFAKSCLCLPVLRKMMVCIDVDTLIMLMLLLPSPAKQHKMLFRTYIFFWTTFTTCDSKTKLVA